jgi:lysyl-tRNA synthetase class 2
MNIPTILYAFPGSMAALAKRDTTNPRYAKRFEFYIAGIELGDCYEELTDWKEQQTRFDEELCKVKQLGKTLYEYDHDFINALKTGMPDASGIAVGLDRLIMLMANVTDIEDITFFPTSELFDIK